MTLVKSLLSAELVKRSLSGHSWLGLLAGALMYLACLSGTVAVLHAQFERWEQPAAPEFRNYDDAMLERAYAAALERNGAETHHVFINLPTAEMPRATISTDTHGWLIEPDGTLGEDLRHDWTHFLTALHDTLTLPAGVGYPVVSLLGVLLCGLIVSGFLAHPSIFKDAFHWRRRGSRRLEHADLHNRLSVWGAPFHLMIAITGAFFGLTVLFRIVAGVAFFDGTALDATAAIHGAEPQLQQEARAPAIATALEAVRRQFPDTPPMYVTLEDVDDPAALYMIVGARHYDRLIWVEQHRFDTAGRSLGHVGYSDGPAGRQAAFSIYRLHFGNFAGWTVRLVYIVFGAALTVVSVTGINVWLAKRKTRDALNMLWTGCVWGAPAALALTALAAAIPGMPLATLFWCSLGAAIVAALCLRDERRSKPHLQSITGGLLLLLPALQWLRFGAAAFAPAALGINATLLGLALVFLFRGWRERSASGQGVLATSTP